jgi:hypothetical protein
LIAEIQHPEAIGIGLSPQLSELELSRIMAKVGLHSDFLSSNCIIITGGPAHAWFAQALCISDVIFAAKLDPYWEY